MSHLPQCPLPTGLVGIPQTASVQLRKVSTARATASTAGRSRSSIVMPGSTAEYLGYQKHAPPHTGPAAPTAVQTSSRPAGWR